MRVAKLWARITIQQRSGGVDSLGQPAETWVDVQEMMSDLRHLKGLEVLRGSGETSTVTASFRIRNELNVTANMRIVWNNYVYMVNSVMPQEDNRYLDIAATRQTETQLGD